MSPDNFTRTVEGAAAYERLHHGQEAEPPYDAPPKRRLEPCAACGEPCYGHWCSNACRRAEDGLSFEEAAEMERMQQDDARDGEW